MRTVVQHHLSCKMLLRMLHDTLHLTQQQLQHYLACVGRHSGASGGRHFRSGAASSPMTSDKQVTNHAA